MPLPKDMEACMHKVKEEHPKGRGDGNGMSKKRAHEQHVAMCLQAAGKARKTEEMSMGLPTFKEFLVEMTEEEENERIFRDSDPYEDFDTSSMRAFIRGLPQYQELMKDKSNKPEALRLARELVSEFGEGPVDDAVQDHVIDAFDDLSRKFYRGTSLTDWERESEWERKREEEKDIESAAKKWERATGMSAETGEELPRRKKRMPTGARHTERLYTKAARQMARQTEPGAPPPPPTERAARAPREGTKMARAREIFGEAFGKERPSAIINRMMNELGIKKAHATTYYYTMKKKAEQG